MRGAPEPAKLRLQACPHVVWNGHTAAGGVVVRHLHRSRLCDELARLRVHDLIFEREAAVADRNDTKTNDESISSRCEWRPPLEDLGPHQSKVKITLVVQAASLLQMAQWT